MVDAALKLTEGALDFDIERPEGMSKSDYSIVKRMAVQAFMDANQDRNAARELLEREAMLRLREDEQLLGIVVREWARVTIGGLVHKQRESATRAASRPGSWIARGMKLVSDEGAFSFLDKYQLESGKILGDADKDDLTHEALLFDKRVAEGAARARWFRALAKRLNGKTVREVYGEEQIAELWRKESKF